MADSPFVSFYNRNTRQVSTVVDETEKKLRENITPLDIIAPTTSYPTRELLLLKMQGDVSVASIVAPDQELPNDQGEFKLNEEVLGRLLIGKQHVFTDKEYEGLEKMNTYMAAGGPNATAIVNAYQKYLLGIAADMPVSIDAKHLILMFQVFTTGACDYTDPLTGLKVELTYPTKKASLFPAAKTGNARWSQPTTADGLADLDSLAEAWYQIHRSMPKWLMAHRADLKNLANQTSTKEALMAKVGGDNAGAASLYIGVSRNDATLELEPGPLLELIKDRTGVDRVLIVDKQLTQTNKDGNKSKIDLLPLQTIVFGDTEMGGYERARVPFKENGNLPGVFVKTKMIDDAPLRERIAGMAAGVPFVKDARALSAQVIDGAS